MASARPCYVPPALIPLTGSGYRPPSEWNRPMPRPVLGEHTVESLVKQFGSPLGVVDEDRLRAMCRRVTKAFQAHWPRTRLACSVKTNYLSAIVAVIRDEGGLGEVVSGFEYGICRDLGIPGAEIIFNGPYKPDSELRLALEEGAVVNIDNDDELRRIIAMAPSLKKRGRVGIRANLKLNDPPWDKFGFSFESGHAHDVARAIAKIPNLELDGLHMHLGTYIPDPALYGRGAEALVDLALRLERDTGLTIKRLDIGGGYATRNTLRHTILPGECVAASPEDYAAVITAPLKAARRQFRKPPELVLEPGRLLIDEAVSMITTVQAVKRGVGQQKAAILDAGVHILPTAYWYNHDVAPVRDHGGPVDSYKLAGPLCMQIDVVREAITLPVLRPGDQLVVGDIGAYNFSQSMTFIQLRPTYVMISGTKVAIIRQAEVADDVRRIERLPPHLAKGERSNSALNRNPRRG